MIKFPKVHLATSVVNQILNVADDVEQLPVSRFEQPSMPEPIASGQALDEALARPVPEASASDPTTEQVLLTQSGLL